MQNDKHQKFSFETSNRILYSQLPWNVWIRSVSLAAWQKKISIFQNIQPNLILAAGLDMDEADCGVIPAPLVNI